MKTRRNWGLGAHYYLLLIISKHQRILVALLSGLMLLLIGTPHGLEGPLSDVVGQHRGVTPLQAGEVPGAMLAEEAHEVAPGRVLPVPQPDERGRIKDSQEREARMQRQRGR